jgi:hypothetical protein
MESGERLKGRRVVSSQSRSVEDGEVQWVLICHALWAQCLCS